MKYLQLLIGTAGLAMMLLTVQRPVHAAFVSCRLPVAGCQLLAASQAGGGPAQSSQPPATAKATAPFDPTGYWVSVITENWRLRMVPPAKGDYIGIPISAAAKKVADAWDLTKDEAAGNQCKYYGAASIMYQPARLKVTWQDDNTLRMDIDSGTQTRLFRFGNATPAQATRVVQTKRTWQGSSAAVWEARRGGGEATAKYLKVTTTNMLPGYLRKNGVPYGETAVLTEYYDLFPEPNGDTMMFVTAVVEDPVYLEQRYIVVSHFKKQKDASGWDPTACSARW